MRVGDEGSTCVIDPTSGPKPRRFVLEGSHWDIPKELVDEACLITTVFLSRESGVEKRIRGNGEAAFRSLSFAPDGKTVDALDLKVFSHDDFEQCTVDKLESTEYSEFAIGEWKLLEFRNGVLVGEILDKGTETLPALPGCINIVREVSCESGIPLVVESFLKHMRKLEMEKRNAALTPEMKTLAARMIAFNAALQKSDEEAVALIVPELTEEQKSRDPDGLFDALTFGSRYMLRVLIGTLKEIGEMDAWVLRESGKQLSVLLPVMKKQMALLSSPFMKETPVDDDDKISFSDAVLSVIEKALKTFFMLDVEFSERNLDKVFDVVEERRMLE